MGTRPPAVAGIFYPADPHRLRADVARLLSDAATDARPTPKALIAPHAGYVYSGPVAAAAFATLSGRAQAVTRVVLIGPAHHAWISGIAAPTVDAFRTPLGAVPVDQDSLAAVSEKAFVLRDDDARAPEHALEVELPFLQSILGSFALVPLLVGAARPQQVAAILEELWGGEETLIVVSSDLSHYLDSDAARRRDAATAAAIERGDWASLGPDDACGCLPVAGLLIAAKAAGLAARRLDLHNSGDTAGGRQRVVGYGAWAFAPAA